MKTQGAIENLICTRYIEDENCQDKNGKNGNQNPKCKILGREKQYITTTLFKYKNFGKWIDIHF